MTQFDLIYRENYKRMYSIAKKMVNDRDVACDIIQDVFVYYYEKLQAGHNIEHHRNWLLRATINKCIGYLTAQKEVVRLDNITLEEERHDDTLDVKYPETNIKNALRQLSKEEMQLVLLHSDGYSYKEISAITGIKFTSIGKTLSRALKKLKDILTKMDYEKN